MEYAIRIATSILFLSFVASCGGGGGQESTLGMIADDESNDLSVLLDTQNENAARLIEEIETIARADMSIVENLREADPTDVSFLLQIFDEMERVDGLSNEIPAINQLILDAESRISTLQSRTNSPNSEDLIDTRAVVPAAITIGCTVVGVTAYTVGLHALVKRARQRALACAATYRESVSRIPSTELPLIQEELQTRAYLAFSECENQSLEKIRYDFIENFTLSTITNGAAGAARNIDAWGSALMSLIYSPTDVATIIGTRPNTSEVQQRVGDPAEVLAFFGQADVNGVINLPPGDWNIAGFIPGQVRFATGDSQPLSIQTGQTTMLDISTMSSDSVVLDDIQTCEVPIPEAIVNTAPVVDAGPGKVVDINEAVTLFGSVVDDDLPDDPTRLLVEWTILSGPGNASLSFIDATNVIVEFPLAGVYVLELSANDGQKSDSDTVTVTVINDDLTDEGMPMSSSFLGTWLCPSRGTLNIEGSHASISGNFDWNGGGTIDGEVIDGTIVANWTEDILSREGTFELTLNPPDTITGTWAFTVGGSGGGSWSCSRP